jgi:tetrahydromethanopterin S-methyltransferase subunit A
MENTLKNLAAVLPNIDTSGATILSGSVSTSLQQMRPIQYSCLGCDHCYPAVAQNAFSQAFPIHGSELADLSCEFQLSDVSWPPVVGEYVVVDKTASVAVSTLASIELTDAIARRTPNGLAIVGKTETENIGIDKVIKNIVTSPSIRYLLVAGIESRGHLTGETLLSLVKNGVDDTGRVIGSHGKRPILRNVSYAEIQAFREQVQIIDMIGCEDSDEIAARIEELSQQFNPSCGYSECGGQTPISIVPVPKVKANKSSDPVKMDKAGYFVIVPLADRGVISVEHYDYDNSLLRTIEGNTARDIYRTIIEQEWVTELSHAA